MPYTMTDRTIHRDGKPLVRLSRYGNDSDGYTITPAEMDAFAHAITEALDMRALSIAAGPDVLGYAVGFARAYLDMAADVTAKGTKAKPTVRQLNHLMEMARHVLALTQADVVARVSTSEEAKSFLAEDFNNTQAEAEGWFIAEVDSAAGPFQLQRDDTMEVFADDETAHRFVVESAAAGSAYHQSALDFLKARAPVEFANVTEGWNAGRAAQGLPPLA